VAESYFYRFKKFKSGRHKGLRVIGLRGGVCVLCLTCIVELPFWNGNCGMWCGRQRSNPSIISWEGICRLAKAAPEDLFYGGWGGEVETSALFPSK
jgi:hypothetical protein